MHAIPGSRASQEQASFSIFSIDLFAAAVANRGNPGPQGDAPPIGYGEVGGGGAELLDWDAAEFPSSHGLEF